MISPFETDDMPLRALMAAQVSMQLAQDSATDLVARARYRGCGLEIGREILRRIGTITREQTSEAQP